MENKAKVCRELRVALERFVAMQENPQANLVELSKLREEIEALEAKLR